MTAPAQTPRGLAVWRTGFPFTLATPRSAIERLRAAGATQVWHGRPRLRSLAAIAARTLLWPLVTFADCVRQAAKPARDGGKPGFATLYAAALTRNIPPVQYARYSALAGIGKRDLADFLLPLDFRSLHALNKARGADPDDVQDKARFERICARYGFPVVQTLATFGPSGSNGEDRLRAWTAAFFVKSLDGHAGAGAELWRPGEGGFASGDEVQTIDDLIDRFRARACIVQPRVEDCAALAALGSVALSSIRLVTARGDTIGASVIAASLSLATEVGAVTSHRGTLCGIDVATGAVVAVDTAPDEDSADREPPLLGFTLPVWNDIVALVRNAHDTAFPAFVTLGWDVALTDAGPLLIETNIGWNMTQHQLLTGPLGKTALAEVIDELLAAPRPSPRPQPRA